MDLQYPSCAQTSLKRSGDGYLIPAEDEEMLLTELTAKLASLPGKCAVVTELKSFFQFKGPAGHRLWRRVKEKLIQRGCVREIGGIVTVLYHLSHVFE